MHDAITPGVVKRLSAVVDRRYRTLLGLGAWLVSKPRTRDGCAPSGCGFGGVISKEFLHSLNDLSLNVLPRE